VLNDATKFLNVFPFFLLLNCVKVIGNLLVENMIPDKLVGRLDNPCLAVPLGDFLANASRRQHLKVSKLAVIFK
jgi:hypothetical protein